MPKKLAIFTLVLFFAFSPLITLLIPEVAYAANQDNLGWADQITVTFDVDNPTLIELTMDPALQASLKLHDSDDPPRINNTYTDRIITDNDISFENKNAHCGGKNSFIKFIGNGDEDDTTSDSGWVAWFWVNSEEYDGDDGCEKLTTSIHTPSGMGVTGREKVDYIDKVFITVDGIGLADTNPWDGGTSQDGGQTTNNNYVSPAFEDCPTKELNVINFNDAGNQGVLLSKQEVTESGFTFCFWTGATLVDIGNSVERNINAYRSQVEEGDRAGEVYVWLPAYEQQFNTGFTEWTARLNGAFGQSPDDDNIYSLLDDPDAPGGCDPADGLTCTHVNFSERVQRSVHCRRFCQSLEHGARPLIFKDDGAITTVPSFYGATDEVIRGINAISAAVVDDQDAIPTCESQNKSVADWLFCLVIDGIDKTLGAMTAAADDLLSIEADQVFGDAQGTELRTVWSFFRGVATFLLLAVGLAMVISQAIGG